MSRIRRLILEVHRRSLWQVLSIYMVGSWFGYQVILNLAQGLGMPDWVPGLAVILFIIGLPIVLATAFVQEGLPGREASRSDGRRRRHGKPPRAREAGATVASAAATAAVTDDSAGSSAAAAAADRPPARSTPGLAPALTWQRAILGGIVAFLLLGLTAGGYMGLRNAGIGPFGSLVAAGRLDDQARILIADFDSPAGDTALAALVTEAFRIDFARSRLVRAVEPSAVRDVLRRMDRGNASRLDPELAREVAIRDGINALVTGEITPAGSGFVLSVRLVEPRTGEVLAATRETAKSVDELIPAIDRLSSALRERIGESLRTLRRAEPLAQVTTSSLVALEKYTQGLRATSWDGDSQRGFQLHQEAVALDTAFAAAHVGIAIHLSNREETERALAHLERAFRHEDRLTEVQRGIARGSYHMIRREHAQAAAALEHVLAVDPHQYAALNNLGHLHVRMGDYARAEHFLRRAIAADTTRFFGPANLAETLVKQGGFAEAEAAFREAAARAPEAAWPMLGLASLPRVRGDYDATETNLRGLIDDPQSSRPVRQWAERDLTFLLVSLGRLAEAERRTDAAARATGGLDAVERHVALRRIWDALVVRDQPERARALLNGSVIRDAIAAAQDTMQVLEIARACAWAGDATCARAALERIGRHGPVQPWSSIDVLFTHAGMALAEADYAGAIRYLRMIQTGVCPGCEEPYIARVFERAGQPDSALVAYARFVDAPSLQRIWVENEVARAHRRLGELYEERGDRAAAARHYARFVEMWEAADPELQPLVAEARRRVGQLVGERQ